jgi:hypothetical protein
MKLRAVWPVVSVLAALSITACGPGDQNVAADSNVQAESAAITGGCGPAKHLVVCNHAQSVFIEGYNQNGQLAEQCLSPSYGCIESNWWWKGSGGISLYSVPHCSGRLPYKADWYNVPANNSNCSYTTYAY